MTGVLVNFATVVVGGLIGSFIRKGVPDRLRAAITNGIALCVLVIGVSGAIETQNQLLMIICIVVGTLEGFDTMAFGVSFVLAIIVMYDATGVRRETGTQATVINQILKDVLINGKRISDEELKELVGHTPFEVLGGAILGTITALCYLWFGVFGRA